MHADSSLSTAPVTLPHDAAKTLSTFHPPSVGQTAASRDLGQLMNQSRCQIQCIRDWSYRRSSIDLPLPVPERLQAAALTQLGSEESACSHRPSPTRGQGGQTL